MNNSNKTVFDKLGDSQRIGKKIVYQVKPNPLTIQKRLLNHMIPVKSMKVTLVLDPYTLPEIDTIGMKELKLNFEIPNTGVKLTAKLNPKTYRKVLKTLEEHQNEVALILQGKITKNMSTLEEAGLTAQPKVIKSVVKETATE